LLDEIDYWEIDPAWDGKVFRSAGQVVRSRKNEPAGGEIRLPAPAGAGPLCLRMVGAYGGQVEQAWSF
jgi:hypothetical protein